VVLTITLFLNKNIVHKINPVTITKTSKYIHAYNVVIEILSLKIVNDNTLPESDFAKNKYKLVTIQLTNPNILVKINLVNTLFLVKIIFLTIPAQNPYANAAIKYP
jgi:hypothetical protein